MQQISEIELKYKPNKISGYKIINSNDAVVYLKKYWNLDTIELFEEFKVMLLNGANEIIGIYTVSKGGISATLVDIRLLFAVVLKSAASSIILVHNHPSGRLKPSEADKRLHRKIKKAAELLDINVLDNIILSVEGYYSFVDEGI